jgi:hypothetical protein
MIEHPHFQMPLQRGSDGKLNVVEQATPEHVASQEVSVALCPVGFRDERPDFGWAIPVMGTVPPDPQQLVEALDRLVPLPRPRTASTYMTLATDPSAWTIQVKAEVGVA